MKHLVLSTVIVFFMAAVVCTQDTDMPNQGQNTATPPSVSVDPGSIDFGEQVAKKPGKPRRITVSNTGDKKLYINSVVISEDDQQDFTITHDTCTGKDIEAKKSCVIDVVFTPGINDRRKSKLVLTDNAIDSPQKIALTGVGINSVAVPPSKSGNE